MKRPLTLLFGVVAALLACCGRASAQTTFANSTSIIVPASGTGNLSPAATANPYPSTITVSGLAGTISKIAVTLNNVSHGFPDDLVMLLVGPGGQKLILWSDAGGDTTQPLTGQNVALDDAAASLLPDAT